MAPKLKPSSKEYIRDKNGRQTNRWMIRHYTIASATVDELRSALKTSPRKRNVINKELVRRGISV